MKINLRKGKDAFECCPCCFGPLMQYEPPDDHHLPQMWCFYCGCELSEENGNLTVESPCPDAMRKVIEALIFASPEDNEIAAEGKVVE